MKNFIIIIIIIILYSYFDLSGTGTILGHCCAQVLEAGNLLYLLAIDVCTGVGRAVHTDLKLLRVLLQYVCSCSFIEAVDKIMLLITAVATH
ncbi:hypothetical protein DPMN_156658 [Dreissena polymorpha]|uniref:Uncharacterized protein n=1 Tax=Dreissena polymorpha TaxID=45954 RepID=A0A9D4FQ83_DREPO|nr:hypothetical protein DPMN_156658 [Dreissena polymorpha]